ncbi:MAG: lipoprotein [Gemmatimonas sp.]
MLRPSVLVILVAIAATGLAGCGKKGSPRPPGASDFPRAYPNPAKYPNPGAPVGSSQRTGAPEQQPSTTIEQNEDDLGFNPGRMTR